MRNFTQLSRYLGHRRPALLLRQHNTTVSRARFYSANNMPKVFLTGASGFIGGDVLYALNKAHPDLNITCLVRDQAKAEKIAAAFPKVSFVQGDLDATEILESHAQDSDIVLQLAATGNISSTKALLNGLSKRSGNPKGYFIQMSGATLLAQQEIKDKAYGKSSDKIYDDYKGIEEVRSVTKAFPNRTVDNYVLFNTPASVQSALIVGPLIYGQGRGPVNQRSIQVPEIVRVTLSRGAGFQIGEGQSKWANINIVDLSDLIVKLVGSAVSGSGKASWNEDGVYLVGNGEMSFGAICDAVAKSAHAQGLISSADAKQALSAEELDQHIGHGSVLLGTNARFESNRARELLGWNPSGPSLQETIDKTVALEAERRSKS